MAKRTLTDMPSNSVDLRPPTDIKVTEEDGRKITVMTFANGAKQTFYSDTKEKEDAFRKQIADLIHDNVDLLVVPSCVKNAPGSSKRKICSK